VGTMLLKNSRNARGIEATSDNLEGTVGDQIGGVILDK